MNGANLHFDAVGKGEHLQAVAGELGAAHGAGHDARDPRAQGSALGVHELDHRL